ncbi:hypothetical protein [Virgibacillus indicus]|nr:hypothetical protein [Virgibacillus indicus]
MKANEQDYKKYSDAINKIQEGNDSMIDLFNSFWKEVFLFKHVKGVTQW